MGGEEVVHERRRAGRSTFVWVATIWLRPSLGCARAIDLDRAAAGRATRATPGRSTSQGQPSVVEWLEHPLYTAKWEGLASSETPLSQTGNSLTAVLAYQRRDNLPNLDLLTAAPPTSSYRDRQFYVLRRAR